MGFRRGFQLGIGWVGIFGVSVGFSIFLGGVIRGVSLGFQLGGVPVGFLMSFLVCLCWVWSA